MKKIYFLSVMVALALVVVACTPKQQEEVADVMMEEEEMMEDDSMGHDDSMMDDDAMKDDGGMVADDTMMEEVLQIEISGKNFEFDQTEIKVKEGQKVKIVFTSESGFHNWTVDEFNAATSKVRDGQTSTVEFTADKKGTFEYYCSVGSHRALGMVGKLIVE